MILGRVFRQGGSSCAGSGPSLDLDLVVGHGAECMGVEREMPGSRPGIDFILGTAIAKYDWVR